MAIFIFQMVAFGLFSGPYGSEVQYISAFRISSKSVKQFLRYHVSIFKMAAMLDF